MAVKATLTLTDESGALGSKEFELNFAEGDAKGWLANAINWAALVLAPQADARKLEAQEAVLIARRADLEARIRAEAPQDTGAGQ